MQNNMLQPLPTANKLARNTGIARVMPGKSIRRVPLRALAIAGLLAGAALCAIRAATRAR